MALTKAPILPVLPSLHSAMLKPGQRAFQCIGGIFQGTAVLHTRPRKTQKLEVQGGMTCNNISFHLPSISIIHEYLRGDVCAQKHPARTDIHCIHA